MYEEPVRRALPYVTFESRENKLRVVRTEENKCVVERLDGLDALGKERWNSLSVSDRDKAAVFYVAYLGLLQEKDK